MKKLIITFLLCGWALNLYALPPFFSYGGGGTVSGEVNVSNDAYNATTWNDDELNAPSRNAVRDKFESLDGDYQPLDTDLTDLATGSPTGTYNLSGATITFGLEASDIPNLSATYQTADAVLAALAALENGSGVLTNDGAGNLSWVAGGGSFSGDASDVDYDNTKSDLEATDVQGAIDEVVVMIGAIDVGEPTITGTLAAVEDTSGVTVSQYWGSDALGAMGYHDNFNPAAPGAIGGTTPAAGDFTDVTADSYATNQSATQAGQWYGSELSGNGTDYQAWEVADEITTSLILKFPNANPLANSIQIFGAPSEGKSTFAWLQITGNSKYFGTDGSGTVGIHDLPAASSGLPEGGTAGQIIVKTESGAEWQDFEDHPAYTTLLNAFLAAGLNTFTFTPDTPESYPYYSATGTFNLDFEVTDTSTAYTITGVRYQLDDGDYDGNSAYDQGSNIWRVALANLTEDTYTLQLEATDSKDTPNTGESSEFTVVVDLTDPVVNIEAVLDPANPATHDGSGGGTFVLDWAEMVTETNPASARHRVDNGATTGDWTPWASPWADVEIDLPETEEDVTITLEVTDLAGNTGSDSVVVAMSEGGGSCSGNYGNTDTENSEYRASTANWLFLAPITLNCGGTPESINFKLRDADTSDREIVICVYSDNDGVPYERLWYSSPIYDAATSSPVVSSQSIDYNFSAGTYWIGILTEYSGTRWAYSAATGGALHIFSYGSTFPTPAATLGEAYQTLEYDMTMWLGF